MSSYKTRPINYEGCHPVIAEHLKRGEAIFCKVWDHNKDAGQKSWVRAYIYNSSHQYQASSGCWMHAEPITVKKRIKKASEIIKWCEDNGWKINSFGGWYDRKPNGEIWDLVPKMLAYCGTIIEGDLPAWVREEWLEEVDE